MKKQLLLGSALLAAISTFSQTGSKPHPTGLINTRMIAQAKFADNNATPTAIQVLPPKKITKKTSAANTWQAFTASMNIYGVVISYSKPLQWNDQLNAVTFLHRKSPTYPTTGSTTDTESGSIVAMITTDCGEHWDSTLLYSDPVHRGRYPQGAIYNPPGNTIIDSAYLVGNGPITHGSGWVGDFYASKKLGTANYNATMSAVPNAVQYYANTPPFPSNLGKHDFACYSFSATDDGKVRCLGTVATDINNVTAGQDSAVMVITGTFNNTAKVFDWAGKLIDPPTVKASDGERQWISRPMMCWNEQGTVGYLVVVGSRLGATGSNVGYQPIVYKTTDGGANWALQAAGIDFNSSAFADVKRSIVTVSTDTTLEVPFFNWLEGMDCVVDANNKLHIFSSVIGTFSNHPDSTGFITTFGTEKYRWQHLPGSRPYLYDFTYDAANTTTPWTHMVIDSMSSEGPGDATTDGGYQDNPWDMDPSMQNQKVRIDARLQMSRTPDGNHLLYTWAESDTNYTDNQKKWNVLPNIKARLLDITTGDLSPTDLDVTIDAQGEIANRAMYHFISPTFKLASKTDEKITVNVPMTVSNSNPYTQLSTNTHWYSCSSLEFMRPSTVGIFENSRESLSNSSVYPNPAKNSATVKVNLVNVSKIQIDVLNTIGQVVKTVTTQGQMGTNSVHVDLSSLSSGIYLVNVKANAATSTKKLIIE